MRQVFEKVLREDVSVPIAEPPESTPEQKLDEQRQMAAQDVLYSVLEMLQRRGVVKRVRMTLHAWETPSAWEARLVGDAYRKRKNLIGAVRVEVRVSRMDPDPLAPAVVKMSWSLKAGGVWYTEKVEVKDPIGLNSRKGVLTVIPMVTHAHRTIDGSIKLDHANRQFKKQKKRAVSDRVMLQGLRLV